MVLRKRLSAFIIASVMVLSVSVNAFAIDTGEPLYTDDYIMQEFGMTKHEYNEFVINRNFSAFALPGDNSAAVVTSANNKGSGYVVFSYTDDSNVPALSYGGTWNPSKYDDLYVLATLGSSQYYTIQVDPGAYFDYSTSVSFSMDDYERIVIEGGISVGFGLEDGPGNRAETKPDYFQLLVNGNPVGQQYAMTNGVISDFAYTYYLTENITSLGYRYIYNAVETAANHNPNSQSAIYLCLYQTDNLTFTPEQSEDDVNTGLLSGLLEWVINIYNSVFVPDSQKDAADAFQNEVSGTVTEADNVKTELDDLEKPEPEEIDTDLSGIISDETYTQQTQIFVDLLKFEKITNMLMIVFTMALISYVLFGKKG